MVKVIILEWIQSSIWLLNKKQQKDFLLSKVQLRFNILDFKAFLMYIIYKLIKDHIHNKCEIYNIQYINM